MYNNNNYRLENWFKKNKYHIGKLVSLENWNKIGWGLGGGWQNPQNIYTHILPSPKKIGGVVYLLIPSKNLFPLYLFPYFHYKLPCDPLMSPILQFIISCVQSCSSKCCAESVNPPVFNPLCPIAFTAFTIFVFMAS